MQGLLIILFINYVGVVITSLFKLPIPGSVLGMLILFFLIYKNILKYKYIEETGNFLLNNMVVFFIPPTAGLIENYQLLKNDIFKIIAIIFIATIITMIVTCKAVEFFIKVGGKK